MQENFEKTRFCMHRLVVHELPPGDTSSVGGHVDFVLRWISKCGYLEILYTLGVKIEQRVCGNGKYV